MLCIGRIGIWLLRAASKRQNAAEFIASAAHLLYSVLVLDLIVLSCFSCIDFLLDVKPRKYHKKLLHIRWDYWGIQSNNITISMASKGRCYDNIFIERFWRTLKHNWIYLNEFNSVTELKDGLNYWIKFYNNERVYQALAYATPYSIYNK